MNTNRTIRIIKGTARGNQAVVEKSDASKNEDARPTTAREAAGNVASWVKEFRQRRRPDPRRAFASLFAEQPAPINSLS